MRGGEWYGDVNPQVIENLKEALPFIQRVDLNGHGEALMNKHFIEILQQVKAEVPFVGITSNGLMIKEKTATEIVKNSLSEIILSIHAVDAELYAEISRPGTFKNFLASLEALFKAKKRFSSKTPVLKFQYVGMKKNAGELVKIIRLAKKYGVVEVSVLPLIEHTAVKGESLLNAPELIKEHFPKAIEKASECGIYLNLAPSYREILGLPLEDATDEQTESTPSLLREAIRIAKNILRPVKSLLTGKRPLIPRTIPAPPPTETTDKNGADMKMARDCLDPWRFSFVLQSGRVRPCCVMEDNMGNLLEASFKEIWNSKEYLEMREKILKGEPPKGCDTCQIRAQIPLSKLKRKVQELC